MLEGLQNATKISDLRRRLLFTFALLAVYRIGVAIPTPGIDGEALAAFFEQAASTVFGLVNLFSGGALERFSIFALGIMPYISASIIFQLLTVVVPTLERLSKEGEQGRRKITQYTRYSTVGLALLQGLFISIGLEQIQAPGGSLVVFNPGWGFRLMTMITLAAGTAFIMWLGEQITERGVGNGISLIIFAGIVASIPSAVTATTEFVREGELSILLLLLLLVGMVAIVAAVIFYGARAASHSGPVCKTGHRSKSLWWAKFSSAPEGEHRWSDSPDFRLFGLDFSSDHRRLCRPSVGPNRCECFDAGWVDL